MSHYSRLKVTPDAPAEVIRAAYRVLAAKYHPDRHGGQEAESAAAHAEMVALNTAYKVLINPQMRAEYDALLAQRQALQKNHKPGASHPHGAGQTEPAAPPSTKVDMDWLAPKNEPPQPVWHMSRKAMFVGGSVTGVVLGGLMIWVWQMLVQHQMEVALSDQYAAMPAASKVLEPAAPPTIQMLPNIPSAAGSSAAREANAASAAAGASAASKAALPPVEALSKMSDQELLRILNGDAAKTARPADQSNVQHPLDGRPLNLRPEAHFVDSGS